MKYIFWDFNGTVLDDVELCYEILNEMLVDENRKTVTLKEYLLIFGFPVESYYAKVYDLKKTSFKSLAQKFIKMYQPRSLKLKLHKGVIGAIKYFKKQGFINVLLSASETNNLINQVKHYQINNQFEFVLGTSDVYAKSKVDVAKSFIKNHNIKANDIIMIGDTLHDAQVARELGCRIILYNKGHQHESRLKKYENINNFNELFDKIKYKEINLETKGERYEKNSNLNLQ